MSVRGWLSPRSCDHNELQAQAPGKEQATLILALLSWECIRCAIHSDGQGTMVVTEECLLDPSRNPDLGREGIEQVQQLAQAPQPLTAPACLQVGLQMQMLSLNTQHL